MLSLVSIAAAVVIIVIIGAALGRFPNVWEWVGIILAVVGVGIGLPSLLQRVFGRAKLLTEYDKYGQGQEAALVVFLKNPPLERKSFLRKLGVRRETISSLAASFRIFEKARVVIPVMQARVYCDDEASEAGRWRVDLAPTFSVSASIVVARWDSRKKKAIVAGDRTKEPVELSAGVYSIAMVYLVDGQPENESREFVVGESGDELRWIEGQN